MKNKKLFFIIRVIFILILAGMVPSCDVMNELFSPSDLGKNLSGQGNSSSTGTGPSGPKVYVVGNIMRASWTAVYWVDGGTFTKLPGVGIDSGVFAISSSGNLICAAGYNISYPCYWMDINNNLVLLDNVLSGFVYAISVSSSDVFTAGFLNATASYWSNTNQTPHYLQNGDGQANTIFVTSAKIPYCAGYTNSAGGVVACYWSNTIQTVLSVAGGSIPSESKAIIVDGAGNIFNYGYYTSAGKTTACYWYNAGINTLPGPKPSSVNAEYDYLGTKYIAGYVYTNSQTNACIWEGTAILQPTILNIPSFSTNSEALAIYVYNGTIYTSGYYYNGKNDIPCYWIYTNRYDLPVGTGTNAHATGILVK